MNIPLVCNTQWIFKMHGATIKLINAQQPRLTNIYKNIKLKLLKANAAVWFNKNNGIFIILIRDFS
jgi:hypothetical protein